VHRRLPEASHEAVAPKGASGWTSDGQLWVSDNLRAFRVVPSHLRRYDIVPRCVVEEHTLSPTDLSGLAFIGHIFMTPDGRAIAFEYTRKLDYLYLLEGLAPPRR